ncbi:hypothetical protein Zm00014a_022842 [Zea mays]|jgi:hypothetical protein|uniref:Uncharacterized protein n=1 Tax=Zea mays TaxID=4577 RepID=A0A3L6DT36_MAIZE|nr:hypothetical protein Zm00014a_022842 [Zea mays]
MQVLRLAARPGAAATITDDDEGPFFDLDFSSSSVRASSTSSASASSDDAALTDLDLAISLHRSRSASPSYYDARRLSQLHLFPSHAPPLLLKPGPGVGLQAHSSAGAAASSTTNAALYGRRRSSSAGSGARLSLRQFMECPTTPGGDGEAEREPPPPPPPRAAVRRYLAEISVRLRRSVRPRRLRKSRSAAAPPTRRDDSLAEKQDGIASAIAHCKESLHRGLALAPSVSPQRGRAGTSRGPLVFSSF